LTFLDELISKTTLLINGTWSSGPDLYFGNIFLKIEAMCAVELRENVGVIIGGHMMSGLTSAVLAYDFSGGLSNSSQWRKLPNLPHGGRCLVSCEHITIPEIDKEFIIVIGGTTKLRIVGNQFQPMTVSK
jgi:hypothetical protein